MSAFRKRIPKWAVLFSLGILFSATNVFAQAAPETPKEKPVAVPQEKPAEPPNAAQIELLETKYRFETNGDSRKEVHALVKINSELGVRQFARLNFDYNRSFQSVEIPLVHISHASGGTADILPSAITDQPNPAVERFPAYHDVRVKSVRILGLEPGDSLEYRVVTTTNHHPLAPDFWLDHSFDRTGVVSQEVFEIRLPASLRIEPRTSPDTSFTASREGEAEDSTVAYIWKRAPSSQNSNSETTETSGPDVSLSTFKSWDQLAGRLEQLLIPTTDEASSIREQAFRISKGIVDSETNQYYDFVSQKIRTVELPLGATGFRRRKPIEILASGYASAEDKFCLFAAMGLSRAGFLVDSDRRIGTALPSPSGFIYLLAFGYQVGLSFWLDLNTEVAPIGMIPAKLRDKPIFVVGDSVGERWQTFTYQPIYSALQQVSVSGALDSAGKLDARVKYDIRGDNELLLRVSFHRTPKEGWKQIAQMLALSDGFRGKIVDVEASDPYLTKEPFHVEYEIVQEKFVDWSKKPVRIPVLLPLPGLPEAPKRLASDAKIELGPPLEVDLRGTLRLPPGMTAQAPPGTSVKRDYASFTAEYSAKQNVIHFSRHLNFVSREISGARFVDFGAFLHAVQNDQSQLFVLEKSESPASAKPK